MKKKVMAVGDIEVFQRHCELCSDPLPLNIHKSRRFCPRKYGINDWCKHQMKYLREQQRITGETPITTLKANLTETEDAFAKERIGANPETANETKPVQGPKILSSHENNIVIVKNFIGDQDEVLIPLESMLRSRYDFDQYDEKVPFPDPDYFYTIIGDYAISWHNSTTIHITKSILLTCLH